MQKSIIKYPRLCAGRRDADTQAGVYYVVYIEALIAAMAPSETAVAAWRTCFIRISPAA